MATKDTKIVVITGCSSGIGMESAALLAKEKGYKVIATMRNLKKKEALEKLSGHTLGKSLIIKELDVSKEESILKFMKELLESEGKIDVLINNAATGQFGSFESVTLEQMQTLFQTNFFGTARITQEVVREMRKQNSGKIIFISSLGGIMPLMFCDFYAASKFAIEGLVGCLAPYLRQFNISVTSIQPGPVETAFATNVSTNKLGSVPGMTKEESHEKDPLAKALQEKFMANYAPLYEKQLQTGKDVAEVVKACVKEEKPDVCIQTSLHVESSVRTVLVDPTGNQLAATSAEFLK